MATTEELEARLEALRAAMDSGVMSVRNPDGRQVNYSSRKDMLLAEASLLRRLGQARRPSYILSQHGR